jgi:hypothetical protein
MPSKDPIKIVRDTHTSTSTKTSYDDVAEEAYLKSVPALTGTTRYNFNGFITPVLRPQFDRAKARAARVTHHNGIIQWTREQSRMIEHLANYQVLTNNTTGARPNSPYAVPEANLHVTTLRRFAYRIGVSQKEVRGLRRFPPFWDAINERKKEILGLERFSLVADKIFEAAINGSYADRKLYLETFVPSYRQQSAAAQPTTGSFERALFREYQRQMKHKRAAQKSTPPPIILNNKKKQSKSKKQRESDAEYV